MDRSRTQRSKLRKRLWQAAEPKRDRRGPERQEPGLLVQAPRRLPRYGAARNRQCSDLRGGGMSAMVNPSTADAETDDPTIRKVKGFSERAGYGHIIVGNLFAFRAKTSSSWAPRVTQTVRTTIGTSSKSCGR